MNRHRLSTVTRACLAFLVLFLASLAAGLYGTSITLSNVEEAIKLDGRVYGININHTWSELFLIERINGEQGTGRFLRVNQIQSGSVRTLPDLVVSQQGEMYLLRMDSKKDGAVSVSLVRWDIGKNRLVTVKELPGSEERVLFDMQISGDRITLQFSKRVGDRRERETIIVSTEGELFPADTENQTDKNLSIGVTELQGLSVKKLTIPGKEKAVRILLRFLLFLAICLASQRLLVFLKRRGFRQGLAFHLCFCTAATMCVLTLCCRLYLWEYLYSYVCRTELYNCGAEAELYSGSLNDTLLEAMTAGKTTRDKKNCMAAWCSDPSGGSAVVCEDKTGTLFLLGDFYTRDSWYEPVDSGVMRREISRAFRDEEGLSFLYSGRRGQYACAFLPETLSSGRKILVGAKKPMFNVLLDFSMLLQRIVHICLLLEMAVLVVSFLVISGCLKPLKDLKKAVLDVASGDLSARAGSRGHNEVALTARHFDKMAEQLERQSAGADSYRKFYEAFLPAALYRAISRRELSALLKEGNDVGTDVVTMVLRYPPGVMTAGKTEKTLLEEIMDTVTWNHGCVSFLTETRMHAAFPKGAGDALKASVQIQKTALDVAGRMFPMGIAAERLDLFSAGSGARRNVVVLDRHEAEALAELSECFRSAAVLEETVYQEAKEKREGFHFRKIGEVAIGSYSPETSLYELMDAESAERRAPKERNREDFEAGAAAYAAGDYFAARNYMIRVLFRDPEDRTARSYVMNCDRKEPPKICQAAE